jgi:predicted metal-dependent hydrolase
MEASLPQTVMLRHGPVRLAWRRSTRARRVSLRVDPSDGSVVITLPPKAGTKTAMTLLQTHLDWISDRIAVLPQAISFADGASVPIGGQPHRIRHLPQARGGAWLADGELHVTGAAEFLPRRVGDFLRAEAGRRLAALVTDKAAKAELRPRRLTVKDTTSRWGSCAPDGSLAFSWRLVMAPGFVQDYVAAHEVAHLRHMNHRRPFWALVDELTPHTATAIPWLKREGPALLRIG